MGDSNSRAVPVAARGARATLDGIQRKLERERSHFAGLLALDVFREHARVHLLLLRSDGHSAPRQGDQRDGARPARPGALRWDVRRLQDPQKSEQEVLPAGVRERRRKDPLQLKGKVRGKWGAELRGRTFLVRG